MKNNLKEESSHQSILQATGVFGFLQLLKIILSVITSKFVAIFLGPYGIGLVSLLTNAITLISSITSFEFLKVGTREIALHSNLKNQKTLTLTIKNLQRIAFFIGIIGAFFSFFFSEILSNFVFDNPNKQHWFCYLSIYFLMTSFANARLAILQGINQIKTLAWCNILIAFFSSIGSIIIYYFLKTDGIIWVVIYSSVITLIITFYFTKQYTFFFNFTTINDFIKDSSPIVKLGFVLSINLILGQICFFIIRLYLNQGEESSNVLGYYQVNSLIIVNYLGLIFNAMTYDFYPKLTSINENSVKVKELVNSQIEIAILLVTPAVVFLYLLGPFIIQILFTKEFIATFSILKFALISVIIKSIVMPLAYLILSKGDRWHYFKQELLSDLLNVFLTIYLYKILGLEGIGIAFIINYLIYGIYVYYVVNKKYEFIFYSTTLKLIKINILLGVFSAGLVFFLKGGTSYFLLLIIFLLSVFYSYNELNKRVSILDFIKKKFNKLKF